LGKKGERNKGGIRTWGGEKGNPKRGNGGEEELLGMKKRLQQKKGSRRMKEGETYTQISEGRNRAAQRGGLFTFQRKRKNSSERKRQTEGGRGSVHRLLGVKRPVLEKGSWAGGDKESGIR